MVAEGTAICVNVASTECSTVDHRRSSGELRTNCGRAPPSTSDGVTDYQARVNGQDVADLDAYRTASPLFTITFPEDNVFGVEPGVAQAVSEGYSFIIAPPPPGEYEIVVVGEVPRRTRARPMSTVNVIVEAPQVIEPPTT